MNVGLNIEIIYDSTDIFVELLLVLSTGVSINDHYHGNSWYRASSPR